MGGCAISISRNRFRVFELGNLIFMTTIFSFSATSVRYVNSVFTSDVRWLLLAALALYLAIKKPSIRSSDVRAFLFIFLYIFWCVASALWSEVPVLSGAKSIALGFVSISLVQGGIFFVRRNGLKYALFFCAPLVGLGLFAGGLGGDSVVFNPGSANQVILFQGLTGNPNMFGFICVMGVPFLIWKIYCSRNGSKGWYINMVLLLAICLFILSSNSRASIGVCMFVLIGWAYGLGEKKFVAAGAALISTYIFVLLLFPSSLEVIENRFIYKGQSPDAGILFSREKEWDVSLDYAIAGGITGVGYGVSIGDRLFNFDTKAVGYGREKANSQLGIVEETGLIGLLLYIALLMSIFSRIFNAMRGLKRSDKRVALGICLGLLMGITFHSFFEAWWGAPGSAEASYFWAVVGISLGIAGTVQTIRT